MNRRVDLIVDGESLTLNEFVQRFMGSVFCGILNSLKNVDPNPDTIEFLLEKGTHVSMIIDGSTIPMNEFVRNLLIHVVQQMTASLEGVPELPKNLSITIKTEQGEEN